MQIGDPVSPKNLGLPIIGELVGLISYKFYVKAAKTLNLEYYHPFVQLHPDCKKDDSLWGVVQFKEAIRPITQEEFRIYFYENRVDFVSMVENGAVTLRELYEKEIKKREINIYPIDELGKVFED